MTFSAGDLPLRAPLLARRLAVGVAALLVLAGAGQVRGAGGNTGRVRGHIVGAAPQEQLAGIKVVLVQFTLDANGTPQGAPIQIRETDASGQYVF
ncbi:MAG TPA: hypothetical protein VL359_00785, partial [bacterium]|nr:hypothetical protein [bacterium]